MQPQDFHSTPFKGLVPYTEEDAQFFFGREDIRDKIIDFLHAYRLTLLYGASGVGKSSVLHAGVVPTLRNRARQSLLDNQRTTPEFSVIVFNSWQDDPVTGLARKIQENLTALLKGTNPPLAEPPTLEAALDQWMAATDGELYVILDQFEEYFQYHGREVGPGTFATDFSRAVSRRNQRIKFLISIREEAVAKLDLFKGALPNLFAHTLRVYPIGLEEARTAIEGPLQQYNSLSGAVPVAIEPQLLEVVLQSVRRAETASDRSGAESGPGKIDLTILQQVMIKLWDEEVVRSGSRALRLETFNRLGGAKEIVSTHFSSAMELLSPADQKTAASIFRYLVTPSGTKIAQTAADLAEYSDLPRETVSGVLAKLSGGEIRILRAISGPHDQPGDERYEIFHDVLSGPITEWSRAYEANERSERVRLQAIRDRQVDRARYSRRIAMVLSAMLVIACVLMFYALSLARSERHAKEGEVAATNEARAWAEREHKAKLGEEAATKEARDWAEKEQKARAHAERQTKLAENRAQEAEDEKKKTAKANELALHNLGLARAATARAVKSAQDAKIAEGDAIVARNEAEVARVLAVNKADELEKARLTDKSIRDAFRQSRRKDERGKAIENFHKALAVYLTSKEPNDRLAATETYINIGEIHADMGNEPGASQSFLDAINSSNGECEKAAVLTSIGDAYKEVDLWAMGFGVQPRTRAIEKYKDALAIYENEGDPKNRAAVLISLALVKLEVADSSAPTPSPIQPDREEAFRLMEQAIELYKQTGDHHGQGFALFTLADSKARQRGIPMTPELRKTVTENMEGALSEYELAKDVQRQILVRKRLILLYQDGYQTAEQKEKMLGHLSAIAGMYDRLRDKAGRAATLVQIGELYLRSQDQIERNKFFPQALKAAELYEEAQRPDKAAETWTSLSLHYRLNQLNTEAAESLKKAADLYQRAGNRSQQIGTIYELASIYRGTDKVKSLSYLDELTKLSEQVSKVEKALALVYLGHGYLELKDLEKAATYFEQGITIHRESKDINRQANTLVGIGEAYLRHSLFDDSISYLNRALTLYKESNDAYGEAATLMSLGAIYHRKGMSQEAIQYYERVAAIRQAQKFLSEQARALQEVGKIQISLGRLDEGIKTLNTARELLRSQLNDPYGEGSVLMSLAEAHAARKDVPKAIELYEAAAKFYSEKRNAYDESKAFAAIGLLYELNGDAKNAEVYKQKAERAGKTIQGFKSGGQ